MTPPADPSAVVAAPDARPAYGWWGLGALIAALAVVYGAHVVRGGFTNFDDPLFFDPRQNQAFVDAGFWGLLDPTQTIANVYLPVAHLSLYADLAWFGGEPWAVHLHSAVLHLLASLALVYWLRGMRVSGWAPWAAALVFAAHPALVESVAWAASRKDVLSGLFAFVSLGMLARLGERRGVARFAWILGIAATAVLALYSKGTALVLPFLAVLTAWGASMAGSGGARPARAGGRWGTVLLVFALTVAAGVHHQWHAVSQGTMQAQGGIGGRLAQVPGAFWHYVQTAFAPRDLNVLYPEVRTLEAFVAGGPLALALLGGCAVALAVALLRPGWRMVGIGGLLFFAALLPFNTALPASSIAAADRYLYLAIPGAALLVAALPRVGPWLATAAAAVLAVLALQRTDAFRDGGTLWRASLAVDEANAVAHLNLVAHIARTEPGARDVQIEHLEAAAAAARYPEHALRAHEGLRGLRFAQGRFDAACQHAEGAVEAADAILARWREASGGSMDAVLRAMVARDVARAEAAARGDELEPLVRVDGEVECQRWLQAHLRAFRPYLAAAERARTQGFGNHAAELERSATRHLEVAREAAPEAPDVLAFDAMLQLSRAVADAPEGEPVDADDPRIARADELVQRILEVMPEHFEAHLVAGRIGQLRKQKLEALRHFLAARDAQPFDAQGWVDLCQYYLSVKQVESALREADTAWFELGVRDPSLLYVRAVALVEGGEWAKAERALADYVDLRPTDRDAARILARLLATRAMARVNEDDPKKIRALLERARVHNPSEPRLHLVEGQLARAERRFADAIAHLEAARASLPPDPDIVEALTLARIGRGWELKLDTTRDRSEAALEVWRQAIAEAPPSVDVQAVRNLLGAHGEELLAAAREALRDGDEERALSLAREARSFAPGLGALELGIALMQRAHARRVAITRLDLWSGSPARTSDRRVREWLEEAVAALGDAVVDASGRADVADLARYYQVRAFLQLGRSDAAMRAAEPVLAREASAVRQDMRQALDAAGLK